MDTTHHDSHVHLSHGHGGAPDGSTDQGDARAGHASGAPHEGTIYTCPMHPEIRRDHPGNCPKCGMTLEPVLPALGDDEENPELRDFQRRFWWTLPFTPR